MQIESWSCDLKIIERQLSAPLLRQSRQFPVITLMGPRQSGKTTLVRNLFAQKPYVNLEQPDRREQAIYDPIGFLAAYPEGCIIDEIQHAPDLLSYIQVRVDEHPRPSEFVLTGSHQLMLHHAISQSLAGRTAVFSLLPYNFTEATIAQPTLQLSSFILQGGLPRCYQDHIDPNHVHQSYLATYLERDVRTLAHIRRLSDFQRFLKLCAGRIGQVINKASLSNDLGLSSTTIEDWLSILEASYILFRLPPFFRNFGKRIIRSPKLYFYDTGVACALLGIHSTEQLLRDPLYGHLFENAMILELLKRQTHAGRRPELYYFRQNNQLEIDAILPHGPHLIPIEIKAAHTFRRNFLDGIQSFQAYAGTPSCPGGILLYQGQWLPPSHDIHIVSATVPEQLNHAIDAIAPL